MPRRSMRAQAPAAAVATPLLLGILALQATDAIATATATATGPVVKLPSGGSVQGGVSPSGNATFFLGIPFSAPPTGTNRWRPPQPLPSPPWSGIRDATTYGHSCPQSLSSKYTNISEDCLVLNVYVPGAMPDPSANLAVLAFAYGGSYVSGSSSFQVYNGAPDVEVTGDVIFVTLNYRLGSLGYLGSDDLRSRASDGGTGNYGFLDQRAALAWVQENIVAFGGAPDKVMLFGESAGAGSTTAHLLAPKSWPLFSRAGMESGPVTSWIMQPFSDAQQHYADMLTAVDCGKPGDASAVSCLEKVSWQDLVAAEKTVTKFEDGSTSWSPVQDGVEFSQDQYDLAREGKWAKVPLLFGSNADEGTMFCPLQPNATIDDVREMLLFTGAVQNAEQQEAVMNVYNTSELMAWPWAMAAAMTGDSAFTCPTRRTARWFATPDGPAVWVYMFTHVPSYSVPPMGVAHSYELPFVFHDAAYLKGPGEEELSRSMVEYWTTFARQGNPNDPAAGERAAWPAYVFNGGHSADKLAPIQEPDTVMNLNLTLGTLTGLRKTRCDVWDMIAAAKHHVTHASEL